MKAPKTPSEGGFLLAKVHQVSGRVFSRLLLEKGTIPINPGQGRILFVLWRRGRIGIAELAKETSLQPSTLTSMLDRLEAIGLVRRVPDEADRRAYIIERTDADRALEADYREVSARMGSLFYGGMDADEIAAFERSLARILENLTTAEEELKTGKR